MAKPKAVATSGDKHSKKPVLTASQKSIDPTLASLFASSLGPVIAPSKSRRNAESQKKSAAKETFPALLDASGDDSERLPKAKGVGHGADNKRRRYGEESDNNGEAGLVEDTGNQTTQTTRKRKDRGDDIEDVYMRRLAKEEAKEEAKLAAERPTKRQKGTASEAESVDNDEAPASEGANSRTMQAQEDVDDEEASEDDGDPIPTHETLVPSKDASELEKSSRTVFLANVSTNAITSKSARKSLLAHLSSFLPSLPPNSPPHKIESLRFRSTAFASAIPKKAAFAKKDLMDATTKSTNAYAVYSTQLAAREAAKRLNATTILDRHLRVDSVAHPAPTDHRRCVFVGNLGFVDDESNINASEDGSGTRKSNKKKEPGDMEEGLWRQFGNAGSVENVRVVRDPKTRVGKGFAYVQFTDQNGVEAALLYDGKKFPPMLPRKLRVVRAKGVKRNAVKKAPAKEVGAENGVYRRKMTTVERSRQGRAVKLLGRAGAAQMRAAGDDHVARGDRNKQEGKFSSFQAPESFVFEGHRASSKQGKSGLKLGRSTKKTGGKTKTKISKRSAAWKSGGGKKP